MGILNQIDCIVLCKQRQSSVFSVFRCIQSNASQPFPACDQLCW